MPVKSAAMALANLSGNQALLASNISSPETNLLCMESNRQIIKCKPVFFVFCLSWNETATFPYCLLPLCLDYQAVRVTTLLATYHIAKT